MTAMQHPEILKNAKNEDLEAMARGDDALVETSLEIRCSDKDLKVEWSSIELIPIRYLRILY